MIPRYRLLISFLSIVIILTYLHSFYIVNLLLYLADFFLCIYIINKKQNPYQKFLWVLFTLLLPGIAIFIYFIFGSDYRSSFVFAKKIVSDHNFDSEIPVKVYQDPEYSILSILGKSKITSGNKVKILQNGMQKYEELFKDLRAAKVCIHMEYYIIDPSDLEIEIFDLLKQKVKEGVKVRVLYDLYGSRNLSSKKVNSWKNAGIQVHSFGDDRLRINPKKNLVNFRNHRKIVTIDNKIGYLGGINIGDEYVNKGNTKFKYWRDTHLKIQGPAVNEVEATFKRDWFYETNENYESRDCTEFFDISSCDIQLVATGPDKKEISLENIYLKLIYQARTSITILTPYLAPDYDLIKALKMASESNVKVRMILSQKADSKFIQMITKSYYRTLLESGVEIYEVSESFVHSKVVIIDDVLSSVGTANFDLRSFRINFELTAFIFDEAVNKKLQDDCQEDIKNSEQITIKDIKSNSLVKETMYNLIQIFAPII